MARRSLKAIFPLLLALALAASSAPGARADNDELDPGEDNPPGCVTATAEDAEQCGAQGRDHFANANHLPPVDACADVRFESGSVITRVLPDGPRRDDGSLAFVPGVCVYLPPGYATSGLRYPVVYLLHGGGGDQADWVTFGGVQAVLDGAFAQDPANAVIAVMPDGRSGQWFDYYDGSFLLETYVLDHVVPFVDRHFRTIADRRGRAITGLSNGGYGALHLAAKAPDTFVAAGSMSGNLGARSMGGLGTPVADGGPAFQEAGTYYYGNVPITLIPNLDPVDLVIDWGATCSSDVTVDGCATWGAEQAFRADNQNFRDQLEALEYAGTYDYREAEGAHAWRWWTEWLRDRDLPFFLERLSPPEPGERPQRSSAIPDRFRFRSIATSFDVFGYQVSVERPAREFLDLRDVTSDGFAIQGSGPAVVVTAPRYQPGREYEVSGTGSADGAVRADTRGRLRIPVDLGPGHEVEQYSPEGRAQESAGGYWTERTVVIVGPGADAAGSTDHEADAPSAGPTRPSVARRNAGQGATPVSSGGTGTGSGRSGATAPGIFSAAAASPAVPAAPFLVLLLVVGFAAGYAAWAKLPPLRASGIQRSVLVGVIGSVLGGVLGYVALGFDFDGGAIQVPGVLGSLAGTGVAFTLVVARTRVAEGRLRK